MATLSTISIKEKGLWSKNDVIDNRYDVRGLARGGMGEVYFVYDREIGRMMAVKTPLPSVLKNEEGLKRFYREAEAWISLGIHPNICSAYYVQVMEGIPRLFVEYVDGGAMDKWLKEGRFSTLTEKLDIAIQIAAGMDHTHSLIWTDENGDSQTGLVHRDLKPANILMSRYGMSLITDFGLVGLGSWGNEEIFTVSEKNKSMIDLVSSQMASDEEDSSNPWQTMTIGGVPFGTPQYMAPEQFANAHTAGIPADIYAYGCILYELFCGRRPFVLTEEQRHAVIFYQLMLWQKMHTGEPPPNPQDLSVNLDDALSSLMVECLAKNPVGRPDSFKEILNRLVSIYSHLTGTPYPRPEAKSDDLKADSLNNQGVSYATINQLHRAENSWKEALTAEPEHVEAAFNLTMLKCKTGELTEDTAVSEMRDFLRSVQHTGQGKFLLGKLHLFHADEHNALNLINEIITEGKESAEALKLQALSIANREVTKQDTISLKKAADSFKWFLDNGKDDPVVAAGYCYCLRELGEDYAALYDSMRARFMELPDSLDEAVSQYLPGFSVQRTYFDEFRVPCSLAVSACGQHIYAGMSDGHINVYDVASESPAEVFKLSYGKVTAIDINPKGDIIASGHEDGSVHILNASDGSEIWFFKKHTKAVSAIKFLASKNYVISASADSIILVWDIKTGKSAGAFKTEGKPVTSLALSPDLKQVYTAHKGGPPCVWETKTGKPVSTFSGHKSGAVSIFLSNNGKLAVTAGAGQSAVILWDTESGKSIHTFSGHTSPVLYVGISADGRFLLSADERNLRVWDIKSKLTHTIFKYRGPLTCAALGLAQNKLTIAHGNEIMVLNFHNRYSLSYTLITPAAIREEEIRYEFSKRLSDASQKINQSEFTEALNLIEGARSLTGFEQNPAAISLLTTIPLIYSKKFLRAGFKLRDYQHHIDSVTAVVISSDERYLITGGDDGKVVRTDISSPSNTDLSEITAPGSVKTLAIDYTSHTVCFGSAEGTIQTWDLDNTERLSDLKVPVGSVTTVVLTSDGRYVFSASPERTIRLFDAIHGRYYGRFEESSDEITTIALHNEERTLISGTVNGLVIFWDSVTGKVLSSVEGHTGSVNSISFSADGEHFLTGGEDGYVCGWGTKTMRRVKRHKVSNKGVLTAVFHPDGKCFAVGTSNETINIHSVESGEILATLHGHTDGVNALAFTPNGWYLYSGGKDATVIQWFLDWELSEEQDIKTDQPLKQSKQMGTTTIMRPSLIQEEIAQKPTSHEIQTKAEKKKNKLLTVALALLVVILGVAYYVYQSTVTKYDSGEINKKSEEDSYFALVADALKSLDKPASGCNASESDSYRESYIVFIKKNRAEVQAAYPKSRENITCLLSGRKDAIAVKTLISEMVKAPDPADSQALEYLLAYMGNDVFAPLSGLLRDEQFVKGNPAGAKRIVHVLSVIATDEAVNELVTLISATPSLTGIISPFLGKIIASGKIEAAIALSLIESLLNNPDNKVRKDAVATLKYFKGSTAKDLLAKGLSDSNSEVVDEAKKVSAMH
ncbi:MAG: protein kinase [Nitrospirae bacterium]|nr:protein kinase [Nitrospirota bacterium]MBF0533419.1 protein kinase [Nitrospirota bacterium]MBF0616055.1 protein kinase [Nitrospirota bacterium]